MKLPRHLLILVAILSAGAGLRAAERIPSAPARYFNDYAGVVSGPTADALNRQLEQYEKESSNQLFVAVYPRMESDSSVEDYTVRVAQAWKVGQKSRDNGAVLFVFKDDHKLFIQVGYGLEATLTDARAHEIVENILKPRFRQGNFEAGLREAIAAMIAATKGEYLGTGRTQAEDTVVNVSPGMFFFLLFVGLVILAKVLLKLSRTWVYTEYANPSSRRSTWWDTTNNSGGGGGWFGGGGGGGGGGGFSGGGGSFGGGGAGGSW